MVIKKIKVEKPFKYLWLKTVEDVNLSLHCAKCLKGEYDERINAKVKEADNILLDKNKVYYLCGVSRPYVWENNFHLAFRYKENSDLKYSNNGITVEIKNAEQLPISDEYIDKNDINAYVSSYCTCRNWQFANYFNSCLREGGKDD